MEEWYLYHQNDFKEKLSEFNKLGAGARVAGNYVGHYHTLVSRSGSCSFCRWVTTSAQVRWPHHDFFVSRSKVHHTLR
jgi:hypothetical protein